MNGESAADGAGDADATDLIGGVVAAVAAVTTSCAAVTLAVIQEGTLQPQVEPLAPPGELTGNVVAGEAPVLQQHSAPIWLRLGQPTAAAYSPPSARRRTVAVAAIQRSQLASLRAANPRR